MGVLDEVDEDLQRQRRIDVGVGTVGLDVNRDGARRKDDGQVLSNGAKEVGRRRRLAARLCLSGFEPRHGQQVVDAPPQSRGLFGDGADILEQLVVGTGAPPYRLRSDRHRRDRRGQVV